MRCYDICDIDEIQEPAMDWARQTIALAIVVRGDEDGHSLSRNQLIDLSSGEAQATAQKLWRAALEECGREFEPATMTRLFARQVLEWTSRL